MSILEYFKKSSAIVANREPKGSGAGGIVEKAVKSKTPSDPVAGLTLDKIDTTYRREVETKGLFLNASYALDQMARLCSPLAEVFNFWSSSLAVLDWEIKTIEGADEKQAEKQKQIVSERFNRFANLKKAIKHLAVHRFNGVSACKVSEESLAIVPPWAVVQNVAWQGSTAPDYQYYFNPDGLASPDFRKLERLEAPDYVLVESDQSILLALLRLALKYREADDSWDSNLSNAGRNQIILTTPPQSSLTETQKTNLESLLISLSEGNSGWLEEIDPSAPIKIQRIESCPALGLYKDRLACLRTDIISLIASSTLNNQTGATGLGSNVAEQHATTLQTLVVQDAGAISEALDSAITIPALVDAGEIDPGETPLVYFRLSQRKESDAKGALELAAMARQAGRDIEEGQLKEMTGLELVAYTASASGIQQAPADPWKTVEAPQESPPASTDAQPLQTQEALNGAQVTSLVGVIAEVTGGRMPLESATAIIQSAFPAISSENLTKITTPLRGFEPKAEAIVTNSEPAEAPKSSEYLTKKELEDIDANLLKAIENLTAKYMADDNPVDEDWIASLQKAIESLTPDLVDVSAIEKKLEEEMTKSAKAVIAKKTAKVVKNRKAKGA